MHLASSIFVPTTTMEAICTGCGRFENALCNTQKISGFPLLLTLKIRIIPVDITKTRFGVFNLYRWILNYMEVSLYYIRRRRENHPTVYNRGQQYYFRTVFSCARLPTTNACVSIYTVLKGRHWVVFRVSSCTH